MSEESETYPPGSLAAALATVPDPRRKHLRVHELVPLLQVTVVAMLCGCRSLYAVAQWGRDRLDDDPELLLELGLVAGRSPSVATLHRVLKKLDVEAFERALSGWLVQTGVEPTEPLAVDGKTLRGIHGEELPGVHLVAVYALRSQAVLTQVRCTEKGAELPAVKKALTQAPLSGRVVMADALSTQRAVCQQIVSQGGEYLLPVKKNQPALLADVEEAFSPAADGGEGAEGAASARLASAGMASAGECIFLVGPGEGESRPRSPGEARGVGPGG